MSTATPNEKGRSNVANTESEDWQPVNPGGATARLKVPGGWLYASASGQSYVPDPEHWLNEVISMLHNLDAQREAGA